MRASTSSRQPERQRLIPDVATRSKQRRVAEGRAFVLDDPVSAMDMAVQMEPWLYPLDRLHQLPVAHVLYAAGDLVEDAVRRTVRDQDVSVIRDLGPVSFAILRGREAERGTVQRRHGTRPDAKAIDLYSLVYEHNDALSCKHGLSDGVRFEGELVIAEGQDLVPVGLLTQPLSEVFDGRPGPAEHAEVAAADQQITARQPIEFAVELMGIREGGDRHGIAFDADLSTRGGVKDPGEFYSVALPNRQSSITLAWRANRFVISARGK